MTSFALVDPSGLVVNTAAAERSGDLPELEGYVWRELPEGLEQTPGPGWRHDFDAGTFTRSPDDAAAAAAYVEAATAAAADVPAVTKDTLSARVDALQAQLDGLRADVQKMG